MNNKGRVTITSDVGFEKETLEIAELWRADAVRDCDGTVMPPQITNAVKKIYSTSFVIRGDSLYAILNNAKMAQTTEFYDTIGNKTILELLPMEIKWINN